MSLRLEMIDQGHRLFRWRGYLPLLLIIPALLAIHQGLWIRKDFGDEVQDIWVMACMVLSLAGIVLRALTVGFVPGGTSGRNTAGQRAEFLNTTGMYSIVRNPLYLANFVILLGVFLSFKVWWIAALATLFFIIYMERIILTEEDFLEKKFGASYDEWRSRTPVILPRFSLWQTPDMGFSWKTVLKREYPGLLAVGTYFLVNEMFTDMIVEHEGFHAWLVSDAMWPIVFGIILTLCLTLRTMKKHTSLLKVKGR